MIRENILRKYSWLKDNEEKYVIMGDDLDAGLATTLFLKHNPNAKLIGIYNNYKTIFYNNIFDKQELSDCIYLDLDIYYEKCRSLGHHILRYDQKNILKGFENSCNLNELENRSISNNFKLKYPLGTIHFLIWLYEENILDINYTEQLIWLADSSFINGQSHKFRDNVRNWITNLMHYPIFLEHFNKIDTEDFENKIEQLQKIMIEKGFQKGSGQVKSRHLSLTGFQCQPISNINDLEINKYINYLLKFICDVTKWKFKDSQINLGNLNKIEGNRKSANISFFNKSLDEFLITNNVFSYVFPFRDNINWTSNLL